MGNLNRHLASAKHKENVRIELELREIPDPIAHEEPLEEFINLHPPFDHNIPDCPPVHWAHIMGAVGSNQPSILSSSKSSFHHPAEDDPACGFDNSSWISEDDSSVNSDESYDQDLVDEQRRSRRNNHQEAGWEPFGSKSMFFACLICNLLRNRISTATLKFLWWIMKELGCELPSFHLVKRKQSQLFERLGKLSERNESARDRKIFYVRNIPRLLQREFANPKISNQLVTYPDDSPQIVSEMWHGGKWRTATQFLAPLAKTILGCFWIGDFVESNGQVGLVVRFARRGGDALYAYVHPIVDQILDADIIQLWDVESLNQCPLPAIHLVVKNRQRMHITSAWPFLLDATLLQRVSELKARAGHLRVLVAPLILFCDDLSGARSKRYNPHINWALQFAGLPFKSQQEDYNIHLITVSDQVEGVEMGAELVKQITEQAEKGVQVYHATLQEEVLVVSPVMAILGDNPMHSELGAHIGLKGNFPCRFCDASASFDSAAALERFVTVGRPRNPDSTRMQLLQYMHLAAMSGAKTQTRKMQTDSGIKCSRQEVLLTKLYEFAKSKPTQHQRDQHIASLGDPANFITPLFQLADFNVHEDLAVDTLHTVLLGVTKYLTRHSLQAVKANKNNETILEARMRSADTSTCFPRPLAVRNVLKYTNSLVGKDFRHFVQLAPFFLEGLVPPVELRMWLALARMTRLIYQRSFYTQQHVIDVAEAIQQFLACAVNHSPRWLNKPKFHILLHIPRCMQLFGPPVLVAVERFEANNSVIRLSSCLSNRQSPSRDICETFERFSLLRHIVSGGFWQSGSGWICAQVHVLGMGQTREVRKILGCSQQHEEPFLGQRMRNNGRSDGMWEKRACSGSHLLPDVSLVHKHQSVRGSLGEKIRVGSYACTNDRLLHKIVDIVCTDTNIFIIGTAATMTNETYLNCPVFNEDKALRIIQSTTLIGPVNVQHACGQGCVASNTRQQRMERELVASSTFVPEIRHANDDRIALNIFCHYTSWIHDIFPTTINAADFQVDVNRAYQNYVLERAIAPPSRAGSTGGARQRGQRASSVASGWTNNTFI
ncbi:hypothetical protein DFS34DRAFT_595137 [Phlyctochytrium arcticum]|nr:hypothetical protein DFS34DRAFT_595137 [Phlyctochytrium arcticum]